MHMAQINQPVINGNLSFTDFQSKFPGSNIKDYYDAIRTYMGDRIHQLETVYATRINGYPNIVRNREAAIQWNILNETYYSSLHINNPDIQTLQQKLAVFVNAMDELDTLDFGFGLKKQKLSHKKSKPDNTISSSTITTQG